MQLHGTRLAACLIADRHREAAARVRFDALGPELAGRSRSRRPSLRARMRRLRRLVVVLAALPVVASFGGVALARGDVSIADVRRATASFHDLDRALEAGYVEFYRCTEQPGVGTMGQHYANLALVGDPAIDPLRPEVLVYEPKADGDGYRLVAVEYVTIQSLWQDAFGATTPTVLGQGLAAVGTTNRYGMPAFFQRHLWLWEPNPNGPFADWNPNVTCRGNGDAGG